MKGIGLTAAALVLIAATPAWAQTAFGRSGGWEISQKREICMMRHPAAGPDASEIVVTKSMTGRMTFSASSKSWSFVDLQQYSVLMLDSGAVLVTGWATGSSMEGWPSGFGLELHGAELPALFAASTVTVHFYSKDHEDLTFAMPPSGMAAQNLERCLADIRAHKGGSGAPAVTPPRLRGAQEDLMTPEDYPAAAIRSQTSGTVTVRLTVNAIGYADDCAVVAPSGSAVLDWTTCGIYRRRARFDPALDAKHRATMGSYDFTKVWIAPPLPPVQY